MRLFTYLVGFLATASAVLAAPDISGLPREIVSFGCILLSIETY